MASEIKIGSRVKLNLKYCPQLIVENIKLTVEHDGIKDIPRTILKCVWYDETARTFNKNDFYLDSVHLDE